MAERAPRDPVLWDRYTRREGIVHLTGIQALVRLSLDQVRRDRAAGRRVAALYSGYPGSPLGGLDQTLQSLEPLLEREDVHFSPGLNEELAAGAIAGSQLLEFFPHTRYDGVVGLWFGKAPGLDRSIDAFRHSNFVGTPRYGGAVALVGDDPFCKSSSLPSHSEYALAHAFVPVLYPSDSREILELARHAFAISRFSGLWVALKIVADVADSGMTVTLDPDEPPIELPKFEALGKIFEKRQDSRLLPPHVNRLEEEILYARLEAVARYAATNGLNPVTVRHHRDRIGLVASGRLYRELETALGLLGLCDAELERLGIRLLKMQLLYPTDAGRLSDFADGLDEIVVVDERRAFLEDRIRSSLFNAVDRPLVLGDRDNRGEPWLARHREITAETLALDLGPHLAQRLQVGELERRAEQLRGAHERARNAPRPSRTPHFCSGCPHSISTRLPEGSVAGGGIGCHTMALLMDRGIRFIGAMGSEGSHWIGLSRFVDTPHLFQNLGDGTYCHSGRLAVRAAVEAGVPITYKILYNGTIAMTGGQHAVGMKPLVDLARDLLSDGVKRIVIVSSDPAAVLLARNDPRVECLSREHYDEAMLRLRQESGVTALIYDQLCANQKQRLERRGLLPASAELVIINEDVCEGCGDCGARSTCVSLQPVPTALGRKTRIDQTSCSDDRSCLVGDCPAFMTVSSELAPTAAFEPWLPEESTERSAPTLGTERFEILLVGIGSTGVVTVNAILVRAAEIEGLHAVHLDQTGLAQRGGKVVSHCLLGRAPFSGSPRVSWGRADVLLAFDAVGAADSASLRVLDAERTRAVAAEAILPGDENATDTDETRGAQLIRALRDQCRSLTSVRAGELAEAVLGDTRSANVILLGTALELGLIPLSLSSVEQAIRDRGIAVEPNLRALRLGRAVAADPAVVRSILNAAQPTAVGQSGSPDAAGQALGPAWQQLEASLRCLDETATAEPLRERAAGLALDLIDYQDAAYGRAFVESISAVAAAEARCGSGSTRLTRTAMRELYRLMAYKDEYEVARLLLRGPFRDWLDRRSRGRLRLRYQLQPPLLRTLGLARKISLGRWAEPGLRLLVALRRLRGTRLDPFGRQRTRREERRLVDWYAKVLGRLARNVSAERLEEAIEIAAGAARIRGFEELKLRRAEQVRAETERRLSSWPES